MDNEQPKEVLLEKKIEAILGIFFLIPPVLGVIAFTISRLGGDGDFVQLRNLYARWTGFDGQTGGAMSAAPLYLGLMAIVGAYLLKGNLRYLLKKN